MNVNLYLLFCDAGEGRRDVDGEDAADSAGVLATALALLNEQDTALLKQSNGMSSDGR